MLPLSRLQERPGQVPLAKEGLIRDQQGGSRRMGSEPTSFSIGMAPESEKASLWATQEKALHEAARKMTDFVTLPHLAARYSSASRRRTSWFQCRSLVSP
jgi:hypothetical protein